MARAIDSSSFMNARNGMAKPKHWRGFQAKNALKAAPVLEFHCFLLGNYAAIRIGMRFSSTA